MTNISGIVKSARKIIPQDTGSDAIYIEKTMREMKHVESTAIITYRRNRNDNTITRKNDCGRKILSMEILWQDLCSHSDFESPDWHEFVLTSRQEKRTLGNQQPMGWSDAKRQILNAIK